MITTTARFEGGRWDGAEVQFHERAPRSLWVSVMPCLACVLMDTVASCASHTPNLTRDEGAGAPHQGAERYLLLAIHVTGNDRQTARYIRDTPAPAPRERVTTTSPDGQETTR